MPTVLIIEDYQPLRILYSKFLGNAGYVTLQAAGCREALGHLDNVTPDIVLVDMSLEDGDGLMLISYLAHNTRFANTELVTITGNDQYQQIAEEHGIEYYLYKPVSMPMLLTLVQRLTAEQKPKNDLSADLHEALAAQV
jgi:CheY-like chemotaxis protein